MSASVVAGLPESAPRFRFWPLAGFLVLCFGAAGIGSALTTPGLSWMGALNKPFFQPPNWVFGPVWTLLYTMMAVSGAFVYAAPASAARSRALVLFAIQLALNVAWSGIFFYARQPFWATVEIAFLLAAIWAYVIVAKPASKTAAWLFVPYGLWVGFATVLTAGLWVLNR
jgi:translocator protein